MSAPTITREQFADWLLDPVTQWVMAGIANAQEANKAEWLRQSWDCGAADQLQLTELKASNDAMGEVASNDFETWAHWNGQEVKKDD